MSDETTTRPDVMAGYVITRPGLYQSRGGDIVQITGWEEGWWVSEWNGIRTEYDSDGRQRFRADPEKGQWDLERWVAPLPASEQLAEIERQATQYTPPEGWRPVPLGETLRGGDEYHQGLNRYIRRIEPQPQPQPEPQATDYTPPEGWRLLEVGEEVDIPGRDQYVRGPNRYIRPIEPQPQPADTADELRSEVSYVQNLLGSEKRRVAELEELVTSLQRELAVAKAELATAAAVSQQLQIELDAAQQVPADLPELRQLRSDLAEVAHDRDQYKDTYDRIVADLETMRETTKAETVEAIIEWLQPFRGCNSPSLALLLLEALPDIMRSLTGLADEEIE